MVVKLMLSRKFGSYRISEMSLQLILPKLHFKSRFQPDNYRRRANFYCSSSNINEFWEINLLYCHVKEVGYESNARFFDDSLLITF